MAKVGKTNDNKRDGAVRKRSQVKNPVTGLWAKRDDGTGQFVDVKTTGGKFKGVRREGLAAASAKAATKKAHKKTTKRTAAKKASKKSSSKKGARKKG